MLERKKKFPKNVLNGAKTLQFITANRKKKKKKGKQMQESESAKQGRCYNLQEKIRKKFFFQKS